MIGRSHGGAYIQSRNMVSIEVWRTHFSTLGKCGDGRWYTYYVESYLGHIKFKAFTREALSTKFLIKEISLYNEQGWTGVRTVTIDEVLECNPHLDFFSN
mgnify:CR=1 FL=1